MLRFSKSILHNSTRVVRYSKTELFGCKFSTVIDQTTNEAKSEKFSVVDIYNDIFKSSNENSFYQAREGAVVELNANDLKKYIPEGLAGELNDEFQLVDSPSWMIRDSGKLLCRILDEFVASKGEKLGLVKIPKSISTNVSIPTLTDRPEWRKSVNSVKHFGVELSSPLASSDELKDSKIIAGEGSFVDTCIKNLSSATNDFPKEVILTGGRGTGKSAAMNQMVLHARKAGWMVLFIPNGWNHVQGGPYVNVVERSDGTRLYDNSYLTTDTLRGFWRAHRDQLKTLPITDSSVFQKFAAELAEFQEQWDRIESMPGRENLDFLSMRAYIDEETLLDEDEDEKDKDVLSDFEYRGFKPSTLEDMVRFGIAFRMFAGHIFIDLIAELKKVDKYNLLVAVDQYNAWDAMSAFTYDDIELHSKDLVVPHTLNIINRSYSSGKLVKSGHVRPEVPFKLKNGMCVVATSLRHEENKKITYNESDKSLFLNIKVPEYSQLEMLSALCKYATKDVISQYITLQDVLAYRTHVGSNPRHARREAIPFFFPRAVKNDAARLSVEHKQNMNALLEEDDEDMVVSADDDDEENESEEDISSDIDAGDAIDDDKNDEDLEFDVEGDDSGGNSTNDIDIREFEGVKYRWDNATKDYIQIA